VDYPKFRQAGSEANVPKADHLFPSRISQNRAGLILSLTVPRTG